MLLMCLSKMIKGAVVDTLCRNDDFEPRENYTSTGQSFSVKFFADEYTTSKRGFLLSYVQTGAFYNTK